MKAYKRSGAYRLALATGIVTGINARTATAGHLAAIRWGVATGRLMRLRKLEVEFMLNVAFGAAQEMGFDAIIARGYTASHTGGVAGTPSKKRASMPASVLTDARASNTIALTAGTHTFDADPICYGDAWMGAIGAKLDRRVFEFKDEDEPVVFAQDEGLVIRNTIAMGATGTGRWVVHVEYDEVLAGA